MIAREPTTPSSDRLESVRTLALMRLSRSLDLRFESLRLSGRVNKWYSAVGNEATTVPAGLALRPGDALVTLHRDLGAILSYYLDLAEVLPGYGFEQLDRGSSEGWSQRPSGFELLDRLARQLLGKEGGFSEGVERSYHYGFLRPEAGLLHLGMISHLGSMIPVAAGCGFAFQRANAPRVAMNFIGDGGTSTGDFHEALNLASVWKLPLVLIIENNRYAFSTPTAAQYGAARLSDRGVGYGIAAETVDGNDVAAMTTSLNAAVARARNGDGPTLIEAMVGRMRGHAEGDDSLKVVPEPELRRYLEEDPLPRYEAELVAAGAVDRSELDRLTADCDRLVESVLEPALQAEAPSVEVAWRPALQPVEAVGGGVAWGATECEAEETLYVDAIARALLEELESDERVVLMGQDIAAFEGAFRTTRGLHARWPDRVWDTPIAESGTLGVAAGAAILGFRPVIEMQFADFVSCGFNQIVNVMAKLYYRWEVPCPVVVRLPAGGGAGAGPFHSQNPEAWFAHTAGLKVVCPANARDAWSLLRASIRDPNPVIFCEHKFLYRRERARLPVPGAVDAEAFSAELGRAAVVRTGRDVTLVGYGLGTALALEAAEQLEERQIEAEVIDLRTLVPLDEETVLESAKKTGRVVVVHEAQLTGGFGGEVAARVAEKAFAWLDAPVRRVAFPDRAVPYAKVLERALQPTAAQVVDAASEVVGY